MKEKYCNKCGGPLVCTYIKENLYFYINAAGKVIRDTNEDLWNGGIEFYCSNDKSHYIMPQPGNDDYDNFIEWKTEFEKQMLKIMEEKNL